MTDDLLQAIDLAAAGQWDVAHRIVQQYDADSVIFPEPPNLLDDYAGRAPESLHLPLLVRLPQGWGTSQAGAVSDALVGMLDIAPTVLDLAGVQVPADIQGKSLLPLLRGQTAGWRQTVGPRHTRDQS